MHDQLPRAGKPAASTPDTAVPGPAPALSRQPARVAERGTSSLPQTERIPGTRLHALHATGALRECSTCREDLAVPDLNYRLVLRCTTSGPDH
jgi:hypothetical protein